MFAAAFAVAAEEAVDGPPWAESCADVASVGGVKFSIVEATDPQGYPGERGTLTLSHAGDLRPACLTWRYGEGSVQHGLGLSLPDAGVLAAAFGEGFKSIHIYRRDGPLMEGIQVAASLEARTGPVTMVESGRAGIYDIEGGGRFALTSFRGEIASVTWHMPDGDIAGMALEHGAFLAAITVDPSTFNGISLYIAAPDGGSAIGRWTTKGAWGVGTETLQTAGAPSAQTDFFANQ